MRPLTRFLAALLLFAPAAFPDDQHHHQLTEEEIGSVHFKTSCAKQVETSFNRGVALLHSFQYEQARGVFADVSSRDASCAMAQWGVAMSHYHGLWGNGDLAAGRVAIRKAADLAAANSMTTAREKAYIDALGEIYREDGKDSYAHAVVFEQKMESIHAAYPADSEAAIFHALTLAITAPKTDKTFANQKKCGEILEPIFKEQPHHPGITHYIIHCYDNPVLAEQGLSAARLYAKIAPASAHANHMPSHIFTRLGLWDESISSNLRSAEIAAQAEVGATDNEARDQHLHAMDYLEYAYLQSGRVKQAKAVLEEMISLKPAPALTLTGDYALAAIPARAAIELGDWQQASTLQAREQGVPWARAITWMAIGVGGARAGNSQRAAQAEQTLASLRDESARQNKTYWSNQIEVQRREVAGWIAEKKGNLSEAVFLLRSAVELEESMDKDAVTPGAVTPAREMLADLLRIENRPQESLVEYAKVLKVAPNRFNALYGAAVSAEATGNAMQANQYFRKLTEIGVGDERVELQLARKKVSLAASSSSSHP